MQKNKAKFPCTDCLTLGICKASSHRFMFPSIAVIHLIKKCSLLRKYLDCKKDVYDFVSTWKDLKDKREYENTVAFFYFNIRKIKEII